MIHVKAGVELPPMTKLLIVVEDVYEAYGYPAIITSGTEGKHGTKSLHYEGKALDFRTRFLRPIEKQAIADDIANRLGKDYDVVLERTHLHVEYDPK